MPVYDPFLLWNVGSTHALFTLRLILGCESETGISSPSHRKSGSFSFSLCARLFV
jgi:hypothetical protein